MAAHDGKQTPNDSMELWSLAESVCEGRATDDQCLALNALLLADEDAAISYSAYLRMHGYLLWHWRDGGIPTVRDRMAESERSSSPAATFLSAPPPSARSAISLRAGRWRI